MKLSEVQRIVQEHGGSIKSFNMASGDMLTSPGFILENITADGTLVFSSKRGVQDSGSSTVTEAGAEFVESITYFPKSEKR